MGGLPMPLDHTGRQPQCGTAILGCPGPGEGGRAGQARMPVLHFSWAGGLCHCRRFWLPARFGSPLRVPAAVFLGFSF
jgi:hypothetical protein